MMRLYCNLIPFRQSHPVFLCPDHCEGITTQCTHQATHTPDLCVVHAQSTNGAQCSHSYSVSIDKLPLSRLGQNLHGHIRPNTSETDKTLRFFSSELCKLRGNTKRVGAAECIEYTFD